MGTRDSRADELVDRLEIVQVELRGLASGARKTRFASTAQLFDKAADDLEGVPSGKKIGRNKKKCERYSKANTRLKNKARKLNRHMRMHTQDKSAATALRAIVHEFPSLAKRR